MILGKSYHEDAPIPLHIQAMFPIAIQNHASDSVLYMTTVVETNALTARITLRLRKLHIPFEIRTKTTTLCTWTAFYTPEEP
jgi:hypothetical protein